MRNAKAQQRATRLRREPTDAERKLWQRLRDRQLDGHKFRRQMPLGPYIADFVCIGGRLIVEVDGGQHLERESDRARDRYLREAGYTVLRFWNNQVFGEIDAVVEAILQTSTPPSQASPARGGRSQSGARQTQEK